MGLLPKDWKIGRIAGAPLVLAISWLWGAPLLVAAGYFLFRYAYPSRSPVELLVPALLGLLVIMACTIIHEAGHALMARRTGQKVERVIVSPFGGDTVIAADNITPKSLVLSAAAGPGASLLLCVVFYLTYQGVTGGQLSYFLLLISQFNLVITAFNLLPVPRSDGGTIVQGLVEWKTGSAGRGVIWTGRVGATCAIMVISGAFWLLLVSHSISLPLAVVALVWGWVVWDSSIATIAQQKKQNLQDAFILLKHLRPVVVLREAWTIGQALRAVVEPELKRLEVPVFLVLNGVGHPVAVARLSLAEDIPAEQHDYLPISAVSVPTSIPGRLPRNATGSDVAQAYERWAHESELIVVGDDYQILGVLWWRDVAADLGLNY